MNRMEEKYSNWQKTRHANAKHAYPFWKTCKVCLKPFQCHNHTQAIRNTTCSKECRAKILQEIRRQCAKPPSERMGMAQIACAVCGKNVWKHTCHLKRITKPTCSSKCNGVLRGAEWKKHGYKGRAAWTKKAEASARKKMTGPNNPAWKGGVTYFKKHGNYASIKYVRCPKRFLKMARKDGYVMEHRIIVAKAMGRLLKRSEVVHHKNHDPTDNRLKNLQLFKRNQDHKLYEHHGVPAPLWQG